MLDSLLVILLLIITSSFFPLSEISLAATSARKIKLKLLADEGSINAQRVLKMQEQPSMFFTVMQIGLNAVAILGDAEFSPAFSSLFILFADLPPKRIRMIAPEALYIHQSDALLLAGVPSAGVAV